MDEKLKITGIEGSANHTVVEAQFNPKEIDIQKSIPWQRQAAAKAPGDLTYSVGGSRTLSCELLFDGSSTATSIQGEIDKLQMMSDIDSALKRPPKVKIVWGSEGAGQMPGFEAVIEEMLVKYAMFDPNGRPLRATVVLKFLEAKNVMTGKVV